MGRRVVIRKRTLVFKSEWPFSIQGESLMPKVTVEHLNARRAQITEAARACFGRKGFAGSTIQEICKEAGLSPGAIYRYFKSKDDIVFAIGDEQYGTALPVIEEMKGQRTGLEILDFLGERFFGLLAQPGAEETMRVDLELWAETLRNSRMRQQFHDNLVSWRDALAALIEMGQAEGLFDQRLDSKVSALVFIAAFLGLELQQAVAPELVDAPQFYDAVRGLIGREARDHLSQSSQSQQAPATEGKE